MAEAGGSQDIEDSDESDIGEVSVKPKKPKVKEILKIWDALYSCHKIELGVIYKVYVYQWIFYFISLQVIQLCKPSKKKGSQYKQN